MGRAGSRVRGLAVRPEEAKHREPAGPRNLDTT